MFDPRNLVATLGAHKCHWMPTYVSHNLKNNRAHSKNENSIIINKKNTKYDLFKDSNIA
jgi:hypothetical protein